MINNQYVKELCLYPELIDYLVKLGNEWITQEWIDAPAPVALKNSDDFPLYIKGHPMLEEFQKRHPTLKNFIKLMKIEPGICPPHIDGMRECTLNIPVHNCTNETLTRFYENYKVVDEKWLDSFGAAGPKLWKSNKYIKHIEGGELIYQFSLTQPALMNTQIPHDIINQSNDYRIIWSWTLDGSFEQAKEEFTYV